MRVHLLGSLLAFAMLTGCGGGGGGGDEPAPPVIVGPPTTPPPPPPVQTTMPVPGTGTGSMEFLHYFGSRPGDALSPYGSLIRASDGNFYGAARIGGENCPRQENSSQTCGAIFRATPAGVVSIVHSFKGGPADGEHPFSALVQASDGALYGTTATGGANGTGIAFRLTLSGDYKVIHHFDPLGGSGDRPNSPLVQAADGHLYGTAVGGPASCAETGCGAIYRLSLTGDYRLVYAIGSKAGEGRGPFGRLTLAPDGALYGTTAVGGDATCSNPLVAPRVDGCGTIYRVTTEGALTTLHRFGPTFTKGAFPSGGVTRGPDGAFYGATLGGGDGTCIGEYPGCGVIFRITPAGAYDVIYAFSLPATRLPTETAPGSDGFAPNGDLVFGRDGLLYGTTRSGGVFTTSRTGTVFSLTLTGTKSILYRFHSFQDGPADPVGGLVEAEDGVFWGLTESGGTPTLLGTLYRITAPKGR